MADFAKARTNMVDCQIHTAGVIAPGVLEAFQTVPRERFVPANLQKIAYADEDLPLGGGRFLLEPTVHARMVQAIELRSDDKVLDVGGGTGYSAAILSPMVREIVLLEEKQTYLDTAANLWMELGVNNAMAVRGKLTQGCPEQQPFSLIFLCGAVASIPETLTAQLADHGRLIAIVRKPGALLGQVTIVQSLGEKRFSSYTLFEAGAHYLPGFEPKPTFHF